MLGLFNTLNLGTKALQANEVAIEVTGQNLANANNPAYTEQSVVLQTTAPLSTDAGQEGTGVEVASIQQASNQLLNSQIQAEGSVGGYWNSQQSALTDAQTQLDQYLNLSTSSTSSSTDGTSTSDSLSDLINSLFNAFQSVATSPTDASARQSLVNDAQSLASTFNQASQNLSTLSSQLNTTVSGDVTSANQLLTNIASLNSQIASATASGGTANDLMDSREQDLENLSQLVNIQTTNNSSGTVGVSIGGQSMVTGGTLSDTLATYDSGNGNLLVQDANSATPLTLTGGSIQGTIDARDQGIASLSSSLDTLASSLISQVNSVYSTGYDLNGNTGADFFTGTGASDIAVNANLVNNPSAVQAAGVPNASGDNAVALQLAQLGQQSIGSLNNQTFSGAYDLDVQNFGNALANANDQVTNYTSVSTMLANQRDSTSGVSLEQECSNLITYQMAYEASSKIVTTVNDMLQAIIDMKST